MKYTLTVKVPVYKFDCTIIFAEDIEKEINKQKKKQKLEPLEGLVYGYAMGSATVHKYFLFYKMNDLSVNTITHEISHLIDYVFVDRDIEPPTGEPRAYLTGYISQQIFDYVFKKKLLNNKWLSKDA